MNPAPKISRQAVIEWMRQKMEGALGRVADAINAAPQGQIIADREEPVRDLFADVRRDAYEMAVQMRVDAAEAALSPPKDSATGKAKRNRGPGLFASTHAAGVSFAIRLRRAEAVIEARTAPFPLSESLASSRYRPTASDAELMEEECSSAGGQRLG